MTSAGFVAQGLEVRRLAVSLLRHCLDRKVPVDEAVAANRDAMALDIRDRALLATLLLTTFRHRGEIDAVLAALLDRPLPRKAGTAADILVIGVAQLLFLNMPPHAVIDLAVRSAKADRNGLHFAGLVNAVLRKVAARGTSLLEGLDAPRLDTPEWLWTRWTAHYGEDTARAISVAHAERPGLDISFRAGTAPWRDALGGELLPNGQLRLSPGHAPVPELPGFAEGEWWIQDAAATFPGLLLGDVRGMSVLDLCAAPGGKTLQVAAAGAQVTAVDSSGPRLGRLRENLARTGLSAAIVTADVFDLNYEETWDAVLLDAPCTATGTIRRHPELPYLKGEALLKALAGVQRRMLRRAAKWVKPGGLLVYCTCSLEPEEGEAQVTHFLAAHEGFEIAPASGDWLPPGALAEEGWVRTLPFMPYGAGRGMDGFFAVALRRVA